jgi:hypothetical protein
MLSEEEARAAIPVLYRIPAIRNRVVVSRRIRAAKCAWLVEQLNDAQSFEVFYCGSPGSIVCAVMKAATNLPILLLNGGDVVPAETKDWLIHPLMECKVNICSPGRRI